MRDTQALADLDKRCLWHPFTPQQRWAASEPLIIDRAQGCTLYDTKGRAYLDGVSSLWTNVHGHRHPRVDAAVRAQLDRMAHSTFLGLTHRPGIELAARLVSSVPWDLTRVFYSDNGSTAAEVAVKMAFQYQAHIGQGQRTLFASLRDAYHGDTLGAVSVGAMEVFHHTFRPLLFETVVLPAPVEAGGEEEARSLERALQLLDEHGDRLAALIVEPLVQGAAGMKMHSADYLAPLLRRARELGVLLIADEVAVGFGRTGTLFAMEQVGVAPDLLCLAKGISAGYLPLAATLATEEIYAAFLGSPSENKQFFHGHTYTGNPLACAAALASLDLFEEEAVLEQVARIAKVFATELAALQREPGVAGVRQLGVMVGIDLCQADGSPWDASFGAGHRVSMAARPLGAIVRPLGDTVVLNPPLSLTEPEAARLVQITRDAIRQVMGANA